MIRKQLYLTPEIERGLVIESRRQGKTTAEIVRNILQKSLKLENKKEESGGAFLLRLAANAGHGPKDLSKNMFSYLYGDKSPKYGKGKKSTDLTKAEIKRLDSYLNARHKKASR